LYNPYDDGTNTGKKLTFIKLKIGFIQGSFLMCFVYKRCAFLLTGVIVIILASDLFADNDANAMTDELFDMSLEQLMDVEITAVSKKIETVSEAPGIVVVVPRNDMVLYGDRSLFQLMQRQPSVYTRRSFVYGESMAGFRGDMSAHSETHTLLLLNGRPIRESAQAINSPVYMGIPLDALQSVELIRGPGSVLYGTNAFTGVVNLKTRQIPDEGELSVASMGGSYGYYDTTVSGGGEFHDFGFSGAVRLMGQQGHSYRMIDGLGVYGKDHVQDKSFSGLLHVEHQDLTVDIFAAEIDVFALGVQPFWFIPKSDIRSRRLFVNTGYRIPLDERMHLELNATYNLQENILGSPAITRIGTNTSDILGEITLFANPTDNANFVMGYLQEYQTNYAPDDDLQQTIIDYRSQPRSFYAQGDYTFGDSVKVIAGMQWQKSAQGFEDIISRQGIIITPFENWGLKILRGEAFRAPIAIESYLADPLLVGNPGLEPETITTYDAQLFYQDDKTYAAVTYFNSLIEKQIVFDTSVVPTSYKNGGEQKYDGIELEYKHFFTPEWHVLGSFMYQNNKADADINPTIVPDTMLKVGTAYTWDWGSAAVFWSHFGTPPRIASAVTGNPKPDALDLVSLNIRIDVSKWTGMEKGSSILTLRGENLLDEEIFVPTMTYAGYPNSLPNGAGRTCYAGLELHF
jgi:outer membrane receptor for ferrienterochelin and colicins